MPNQPKTPQHSFRVNTPDWLAAKANATARGEVWSERLRQFVKREAKRPTKDDAQ